MPSHFVWGLLLHIAGAQVQTHPLLPLTWYVAPDSPLKVLLGLPYDGAIDIWSLGCISVELFLGLPIFPGVSDHNQICRIVEMTGNLPEFMLENGKDTLKFYKKVRSFAFGAFARQSEKMCPCCRCHGQGVSPRVRGFTIPGLATTL